ncbi:MULTISPECIES: hypothetical protein [unclassified Thermoactinomyces]|uniref:hypothetical protein n=1 Tax=unclassified Thermoactinomyces TaxID=2634588 RepID=UPI000A5703D2|nr:MULTISPECIES: hypothetical protein [unclassified Thermoactinomyces]MBH8604990.1 hypothetical protein [Thermoactinomyces sp. CICC 10522]MBH8608430.1 hypothetical protein [Thermoactinomyces sp. CICC 10521]
MSVALNKPIEALFMAVSLHQSLDEFIIEWLFAFVRDFTQLKTKCNLAVTLRRFLKQKNILTNEGIAHQKD